MPSEKSLELAAQAWHAEKTKHKEMDADLCEAFAVILDQEKEKFKELIDTIIIINKTRANKI